MKKHAIVAAGALMSLALPALAEAAPAFATANVNMRSGPSTQYPPVLVIPYGSGVEIYGCMERANWCDVNYAGYRGWVSGSYLQASYAQRRVYVDPQYYRPLGIPSVTFSIDTYWDRHYRGRDFYRDRDRWREGYVRPPRYEPYQQPRPRTGYGSYGTGQWSNDYGQPPQYGGQVRPRPNDGYNDRRRDRDEVFQREQERKREAQRPADNREILPPDPNRNPNAHPRPRRTDNRENPNSNMLPLCGPDRRTNCREP